MASRNVETYRAGHEAFNRRDFEAMTKHYADSITWTDHAQGRTFRTPQEFRDDFLAGWVAASSRHPDHRPPLPRRRPDGGVHLHRRRHAGRAARTVPRHRQGVRAAAVRDVALRLRAGGSSVGTSTTTRSRCSRSWA